MDEYVQKIVDEIAEAREQGRKGVFKINEKIADTTALLVQSHFKDNPDYDFILKKCQNCSNIWDILIYFRKL